MKLYILFAIVFIIQITSFGCAPFRDVGNTIGEGVGEVSDELGAEKKIGEGDRAIIVHPQDDKKIKMAF